MQLYRAVTLAIALLGAGACKKDASTTGAPAREAMGLYAKGFNALIAEPKDMLKEYFEKVPETGPDPAAKKIQLFPRHQFAARRITEAREAFEAARRAAPESMAALGPASERALAAIDKVSTAFIAAHSYYESESYKDDQYAKGKTLHAELSAAAKEFRAAIAELDSGLSGIEDAQALAELESHSPKTYGHWFRRFNIDAKKFLRTFEQAQDPAARAKLPAALEPLESTAKLLEEFVDAQGTGLNKAFNAYLGTARSFANLAKKVSRGAGEGAANPQDSNMLVGAYNNLVDLGNSLYKLEDAGGLK